MSSRHVEMLHGFFALGEDVLAAESQVDRAFREYLDEDFEIRWPPTWPEGQHVFRGREGIARFYATLRDAWAEWRVVPERYFDAGDQVVVFIRVHARGAGSGAEVAFERAQLWSFRGDRAISMEVYADQGEALEAAGLPPPGRE